MKERELREAATCLQCGEKIGACGSPFFYRLTIERYGVKMDSIRRQTGLAQFMGNARLAEVMGAGEDMARPVMQPITVTICDKCALPPNICVAEMAERATEEGVKRR